MPRKLLLTQSQVHVVLITVIICGLSAVVFLVGVIVQQRTVQGLHAVIRPKAPPIQYTAIKEDPGRSWTSLGTAAKKHFFSGTSKGVLTWNDFAYVQLVHTEEEACNALITFSQLRRGSSPVPRLLVFPQEWTTSVEDGNWRMDGVQQLLKKASRRYKATLVPMQRGDVNEALPLTSLYALDSYRQVMTLPLPGLITNSDLLDNMLLSESGTSLLMAPNVKRYAHNLDSPLLIKPSRDQYELLLANLGSDGAVASPQEEGAGHKQPAKVANVPFTTSESLRTRVGQFNTTAFYAETAYLHLSDSNFVGPEYDVPYEEIVKARPRNADQSFTWERMQSTYKDLRYRVCGLDLLDWPPKPTDERTRDRSAPSELK